MPYFGTSGNDTLSTNAELNVTTYYGYLGDDLILFGNKTGDPVGLYPVLIEGGAGDDVLTGNISNDTLYGGDDNDVCYGNGGDDIVYGGEGGDTLTGNEGFDRLSGGFGDDHLFGGSETDSLDGGFGDDTLEGGADEDFLSGGFGFDIASYQSAGFGVIADLLFANQNTGDAAFDHYDSIESLEGTFIADKLRGDDKGNTLYGLSGDDVLTGRGGFDYLFGDIGKDSLFGGESGDYLDGGTGDDLIVSGPGGDLLFGGAGNDTFRYTAVVQSKPSGAGRDTIHDFASGDTIDLSAIDANQNVGGNQAFKLDSDGIIKAGEIWFKAVNGTDTIVRLNTGGTVDPDMAIYVQGQTSLAASDFVL
jgi:Ca2+-binding RTX toxin-like protein